MPIQYGRKKIPFVEGVPLGCSRDRLGNGKIPERVPLRGLLDETMITLKVALSWGQKCTRCGRTTFTHAADNGHQYCGPCSDILKVHGLAKIEAAP